MWRGEFRRSRLAPQFLSTPADPCPPAAARSKSHVSLVCEFERDAVRELRLELRGEVAVHQILDTLLQLDVVCTDLMKMKHCCCCC